MDSIFVQFSLILAIVLVVSIFMRILKQPLIIGYILSGIIAGPIFLNLMKGEEVLSIFSEIGIAFLLFIVGLHLSPKVIKEVGKVSLVTGIGQIIFTSVFGFLIAFLFGFSLWTSIYIAVALTFSSTIIIMKLLSDKEALEKLYGKISIGFLLVQDLVAIIILIVISSTAGNTDGSGGMILLFTLLKGIGLTLILFALSYFILPRLENFFGKSQEFLFLFAIVWGIGLASLFYFIGFSIEVGALIAGILLSSFQYSYEVGSKLKPLRDFFLIFFFLILGSQMIFSEISNQIIIIIVFSLFILIGNPLIVMFLMKRFGYTKKTGFMAGLTVAQISEFSLILIALGVKFGHLSLEVLSLVTIIGLITIAGSSYMIIYSESIFNFLSRFLSFFEKKNICKKEILNKKYKYVLLGYNRVGYSILKTFDKITKNYLVIDFNPQVVKDLKNHGINCIYGDADDVELLDALNLKESSVIVSTIPDKDVNLLLLNKFKKQKGQILIVTSRDISDSLEFYKKGADYVILPHFLGGEFISSLIQKAKDNSDYYNKEKQKEIKNLRERSSKGHKHPKIEK
jgi:Kef-type K+ transport system membrane component KefB